jgi:hypothetical protein
MVPAPLVLDRPITVELMVAEVGGHAASGHLASMGARIRAGGAEGCGRGLRWQGGHAPLWRSGPIAVKALQECADHIAEWVRLTEQKNIVATCDENSRGREGLNLA